MDIIWKCSIFLNYFNRSPQSLKHQKTKCHPLLPPPPPTLNQPKHPPWAVEAPRTHNLKTVDRVPPLAQSWRLTSIDSMFFCWGLLPRTMWLLRRKLPPPPWVKRKYKLLWVSEFHIWRQFRKIAYERGYYRGISLRHCPMYVTSCNLWTVLETWKVDKLIRPPERTGAMSK